MNRSTFSITKTLRMSVLHDAQVLLPQLISGVIDIPTAEIGETLTRRPSDDYVCFRNGTIREPGDVAPEGVILAEVRRVGRCCVKVPLH